MAAKEKSRDELDMQTLRELATLSCNKFCFDCGQRGPSYVNVTIGSFVCSTCGGLLRGLTPPHRVKSLTVASFTEVEMDRMKSRGNEYCKHIWLGKYDAKNSELDLACPEKRKEFMIQKYEDKRYYVDPREAIKKMKPRAPPAPSTSASATVTQSRSSSITFAKPRAPRVQRPGVITQTQSAGDISTNTDNEFSKEKCDPFANDKQGETEVPSDGAFFADFNSAFGKNEAIPVSDQPITNTTTSSTSTPHVKKPAPPPPDRYAALADLDNELHQQTIPVAIETNPPPALPPGSAPAQGYWAPPGMAVYVQGNQNPFGATQPWTQPIAIQNSFPGVPQPIAIFPGKAFPPSQPNGANQMQSLGNGTAYWMPAGQPHPWGGAYPVTLTDAFANKCSTGVDTNSWSQAAFQASIINPFQNGPFVSGQPNGSFVPGQPNGSFVPGHPPSMQSGNPGKNPFL